MQLVGPDALPEKERVVLDVTRMIREDFLQQNAFHDVDTYCSPQKQIDMLEIILKFYDIASEAVDKGASVDDLSDLQVKERIARMKEVPEDEFEETAKEILEQIKNEIEELM